MFLMNTLFMAKMDEAEIDRIWKNTRKYRTSNSEVAVLFDLGEGLKESGYKYSDQLEDEQWNSSFVMVNRNTAGQALEILCDNAYGRRGTSSVMLKNYKKSDPAFSMRLNGEEYNDGKLGFHPSSVLESQDLVGNPELMVLLVGELSPRSYFSGEIKTDSKNKEIVVEYYKYYIDDKERGIDRFKKRDLTESEALASAANIASTVSMLSSLENRAKDSSDMSLIYFDWERNIGGKLGLGFENPYLTISGKPLYEIGAINQNIMKRREVEKRFSHVNNSRAVQQIGKAIENYEKNIDSGKGPYFPMFKVL